MARRLKVPLVRVGFPIHDRDRRPAAAAPRLPRRTAVVRPHRERPDRGHARRPRPSVTATCRTDDHALDLSRHPCFNDAARHTFARIHLPVAPECNVQCNFCKRIYDCANESRPGVTSAVLTPPQALRYLESVLKRDPRIAVVGIAGPGDPFATPERTLETLRLVRQAHPEMLLCVASNGLNVAPYVDELAALAVSHVTLTVNAVDPEIGAKIYAWVRDGKRVYRGPAGAELLWTRQAEAIRALQAARRHGEDQHDHHPRRERRARAGDRPPRRRTGGRHCQLRATVPGGGDRIRLPGRRLPTSEVAAIRAAVSRYLPIMEHCTRCRADAVGLLGEPMPPRVELALLHAAAAPLPTRRRPALAWPWRPWKGCWSISTWARPSRLAILRPGAARFSPGRDPARAAAGGGRDRWLALAETLHDCRALLVASAGAGAALRPRRARNQGDLHGGPDRGGARRRVPRRRNPRPAADGTSLRQRQRLPGNGQGCM